jgi:hypothetical protein
MGAGSKTEFRAYLRESLFAEDGEEAGLVSIVRIFEAIPTSVYLSTSAVAHDDKLSSLGHRGLVVMHGMKRPAKVVPRLCLSESSVNKARRLIDIDRLILIIRCLGNQTVRSDPRHVTETGSFAHTESPLVWGSETSDSYKPRLLSLSRVLQPNSAPTAAKELLEYLKLNRAQVRVLQVLACCSRMYID